METKELLFNLIKKLESGELVLKNNAKQFYRGAGDEDGCEVFYLVDTKNNLLVNIGKRFNMVYTLMNYDEDWNKEFKNNFYQSKGIKCWVKDCPNKVCVEKGDHKKLRLQCIDDDGFHKRIVCKACAETDYIHQLIDGVY